MTLLENAKIHFARVRVLEAMIADIDGLCGCGITTVGKKSSDTHSNPTFKAVQELEHLRAKLLAEKEQSARDYIAAEAELATVSDDEMRLILYWRHMRNLPWHEVAKQLDLRRSSDTVKQRYCRYIRRLKHAADASADPMQGGTAVC